MLNGKLFLNRLIGCHDAKHNNNNKLITLLHQFEQLSSRFRFVFEIVYMWISSCKPWTNKRSKYSQRIQQFTRIARLDLWAICRLHFRQRISGVSNRFIFKPQNVYIYICICLFVSSVQRIASIIFKNIPTIGRHLYVQNEHIYETVCMCLGRVWYLGLPGLSFLDLFYSKNLTFFYIFIALFSLNMHNEK